MCSINQEKYESLYNKDFSNSQFIGSPSLPPKLYIDEYAELWSHDKFKPQPKPTGSGGSQIKHVQIELFGSNPVLVTPLQEYIALHTNKHIT